MQQTLERWKELAKLAETEQDPDKLIALIEEINKLLDGKSARLAFARLPPPVTE